MPPKDPPKPNAGPNPRKPSTTTTTTTFTNPLTSTLLTALQSATKTNTSPQNPTFTNKSMLALPPLSGKTNEDIFPAITELLKTQWLVLLKDPSSTISSSSTPLYRLRPQRAVDNLRGLDITHKRIYSMIEGSARHGIWSKPLTRMADVHQAMFNKIMRMLESRKLVKQMRNVKTPSRKMWILWELEPVPEATGGPWYTDGELDEALVETVSNLVVRWIEQKSWRTGPKSLLNAPKGEDWEANFAPYVGAQKRPLLPYPPEFEDYPTAGELATDLEAKGVVEGKDITKVDVQMLLDVLEFDGRIERVGWKEEEDEEEDDVDVAMADDGLTGDEADGLVRKNAGDDTGIPTGQDGEEDPTSDAELPEDNISQSIEQEQEQGQDSEPEVDPEASREPDAKSKPDRKRKRILGSTPQPKAQKKGKKGQSEHSEPDEHSKPDGPSKPEKPSKPAKPASSDTSDTAPQPTPSKGHLVPTYRSIRRPTTYDSHLGAGSAFAETPCSRCPVFDLCQEGGPVNAKDCGYFEGWLRSDARSVGAVGEVRVGGGGGLEY